MPRPSQRGVVLIAVLWLAILLSSIAISLSAIGRTEIRLTENVVERARARALAEAGITRGALALIEPHVENKWATDGTPYDIALGEDSIVVSIQDEAGKIDLNTGSTELLRSLFAAVGLDPAQGDALVDAILDWRDPDDLRRLNGAEDPEYAAAGLGHGAKDGDFDSVEELQQVLGMTAELHRQVAPALTVYSRQPSIDPAVAPKMVLLALPGMDEARAERVLAARADEETTALGPAPASVGRAYSVRALARTAKGAEFAREAVVRLTVDPQNPVVILAWRQGEWPTLVSEDARAGGG